MSIYRPHIQRSRQLRKNMTAEEKLLWRYLRGRKFHGFKFLRQHPIFYDYYKNTPLYFIPDFYCVEKGLVIELDGIIHDFQKGYDTRREEILEDMGLSVIRFKNNELERIDVVLDKIREVLLG